MGNLAYDASVVGTDPSSDLAVLKLNTVPKGLKPIQFADSGKLVVGQGVMAIGNPLGLSGSVTTGVISALNRPVTTSGEREGVIRNTDVVVTNAIQTSAPINPGNSGGALVDSGGRLIGINSSIASLSSSEDGNTSGSIGIGFAIPANQVKNIADQLISNGKARHALLGLSASDAQAEKSDGSKMMGALVRTVTPGGVADKAGIKKNDLIVAVNGTTVGSSTSLVARVREQPVGSTVKIKILRDGKDQEVTATLRDAKR
jgi:2-hexadecenal reductase